MQTLPSPKWTCTGCWTRHDGDHSHEQCEQARKEQEQRLRDRFPHLLAYARAVYRTMGVLPLHVAAELMEEGFIVKELETQWDNEK